MATRQDVVNIALSQVGMYVGDYDQLTTYTESFDVEIPIAWCDVWIAWCYEQAGIPLPKMGSWIRSGSQYCPDSWNYAVSHGAARANILDAQPADQLIFNWNGNWSPLGGQSHTEMVVQVADGGIYSVGGNSGPSGGVNRHFWGPGQFSLIQGVIDTSKLVTFTDSEEFVMDAEAEAAFAALNKKIDDSNSQLVTVIEGVPAGRANPFGLVGIKDLAKRLDAQDALLAKIAAKIGVK